MSGSRNVVAISDTNFDSEVLKADAPVLVDFTATWCNPCKLLAPIVDKIAADVTRIVRSSEIGARLADDGWEPGGGTPEEFTALWLKTSKELGAVIQQRHITIE